MQHLQQDIRIRRERLGLSQAKLAEIAQVPQHMLSAYELGKASLPDSMLEALENSLSDELGVAEVAQRRKRYQEHRYEKVQHAPDRIARAAQTPGNAEYREVLDEIARRHKRRKETSLQAISLFSGCGGFSLGFSAAGFKVAGFLELDAGLRRIYRDNFQSSAELGADITTVPQTDLMALASQIGEVDAMIGGPPCQGFSLSGKRKVDDPRNVLFRHYLRFVDAFRPKVAILENVRLLMSMKGPSGRFVKDDICDEFACHGYVIRPFEVNAKDYGVPQHRERVLFVAMRKDLCISPNLPEPTHGVSAGLFTKSVPFRSFGDACSDLAYLESGETSANDLHEAVKHPSHIIRWLWDVPEGCSAHENEDESLRPPSGYNTTYKRQVWTEPGSTVQTTFGMISGCRNVHPIATRSLTIREAARLQSFPDEYEFSGTLGTIRTGIGNAVPPLLSFTVGKHVAELLS